MVSRRPKSAFFTSFRNRPPRRVVYEGNWRTYDAQEHNDSHGDSCLLYWNDKSREVLQPARLKECGG